MVQATTWSVPLVGPATPTAMATRIDDSLGALLSLHRGASRPAYATGGMLWVDDTGEPWLLKMYDGAADRLLGDVNPSSGAVRWRGSGELLTGITSGTVPLATAISGLTATTVQAALAEIAARVSAAEPFESAELAVTAGSSQAVAHGLGGRPTSCTLDLRCVVADVGYDVGAEVEVARATHGIGSASVYLQAVTLSRDATHCRVTMTTGAIIGLARPDTFAMASITPARWRWVIRAAR